MGVTGVRMFGKEERYSLPISTAVTRSIQKQLFVKYTEGYVKAMGKANLSDLDLKEVFGHCARQN